MKKPNIVYIHAHDLGRFCEPMGYNIPSPNLKRLAEDGVLFRQCHAAAPQCAPSRAALVTGEYPHNNGMMGFPFPHQGFKLNDYGHHIGAFLKKHGYETALSGMQHVAARPINDPKEVLPYDRFLNHTRTENASFDPTTTASAAVDYLQEDHDRPFFLSVGFLEPHRMDFGPTFICSEKTEEPADIERLARYCRPWPHMPDNALTRREMANFKIGVAYLDREAGKVLDALDAPEPRRNTLVIFTTDHGPGVCEMKCTLTDRGTGVVTIFRGPTDAEYGQAALFRGGQVSDALTQHLDFFPTFAELIGAEAPVWLDGKSIMPLLRGDTEVIHEAIVTEQTYHARPTPRPLRAVRTQRYKYIRSYDRHQQRGADFGPPHEFLAQYGYLEMPFADEMLYDLVFDPNEANNVAEAEPYAEVTREMRERLLAWQEATGDPMIDGTVPPLPAEAAADSGG